MTSLLLLNLLLVLAGPFVVTAPLFVAATLAGGTARRWRMPRLSLPTVRLEVAW